MNKINIVFIIIVFLINGCSTTPKKRLYPEKQTQVIELTGETYPFDELAFETKESKENTESEDESDIEILEETRAVVVERKLFNLGRNPTQGTINGFRQNLDDCFVFTIRQLDEEDYYDKGLSYMIIPSGAVYPFSRTEVRCIAGSPYAEDIGREFCEKFFECAKQKYEK